MNTWLIPLLFSVIILLFVTICSAVDYFKKKRSWSNSWDRLVFWDNIKAIGIFGGAFSLLPWAIYGIAVAIFK